MDGRTPGPGPSTPADAATPPSPPPRTPSVAAAAKGEVPWLGPAPPSPTPPRAASVLLHLRCRRFTRPAPPPLPAPPGPDAAALVPPRLCALSSGSAAPSGSTAAYATPPPRPAPTPPPYGLLSPGQPGAAEGQRRCHLRPRLRPIHGAAALWCCRLVLRLPALLW